MSKNFVLLIILSLIFFASCTKKDEQQKTDFKKKDNVTKESPVDTVVSFEKKSIFQSYNKCDTANPGCSFILINYIEMKGSPVKDKFNGYTQRILKDSLYNTGI